MWECMGYPVRWWIPSHCWNWCSVKSTLIVKPYFRLKNEPLGKNSIAQLMPKISKKARLSQVYTTHCMRASTIIRLHQAGVDAKQICAITKHKNEQSLTSFIKDSSASQKRACSDILSRPFVSKESVRFCMIVSFAASSQTHSVQPIIPNCQFSNCTINFNTYK